MPGHYHDSICDQNNGTGVTAAQRKSTANRFSFTRAELGDNLDYPDGFTFPGDDRFRSEDLPNDSLQHHVLLAQHHPRFANSDPQLSHNDHSLLNNHDSELDWNQRHDDHWGYSDYRDHSEMRENGMGRFSVQSNLDSDKILDAVDRQEATNYMHRHESPVRVDKEKPIKNGPGHSLDGSPNSTISSNNSASPKQGVLRGGLNHAERVEKKKKKVRVRRHDSLITSNDVSDGSKDVDRSVNAIEEDDYSFISNDNNSIISENSYAADVESVNLSMDRRQRESTNDHNPDSRGRPPLPRAGNRTVPRPRSAPTIEGALRARSLSPDSFASLERRKRNATDFFIDLKDLRNSFGSEGSDRSSRVDPQMYQSYAAGILNSSHPAERFLHLQKHYATLERISELEMASIRREEQLDGLPSSLAYGSLSERRKLIMSRYKLENLEELRELYANLTDAQMADEFFFDPHLFDDYQWSAFKDIGLRCRSNSLDDIREVYEGNKTPKNSDLKKSRRRRLEEFRRELSYKKLSEKYKHLDEASRKEKILNEMWQGRSHSRRGSDASSVISTASTMTGSYIMMMENAAEKAKQRPLYGYNIKDNSNRYEMHVDRVKRMSKSMPDVSKSLHVRSESEPKSKDKKFELPNRSSSFKQTNFSVNASPKQDSSTGDDSFGSTGNKVSDDDKTFVVMPVYGYSRGPSVGSKRTSAPLNVDTNFPHRRSKENESPGSKESSSGFSSMSQGTLLDEVDGNSQGRMKRRDVSRGNTRRTSGRSRQDQPAWKSEIRGVIGVECDAPVRSVSEHDLLRSGDKARRMLSRSQENLDYVDGPVDSVDRLDRKELRFREEDLLYKSDRKHKTDEAWSKVERERWRRKDSKPNPGAVSAALQMYEQAMKQHQDELAKDVWYPERRAQVRASMRGRSSKSYDDLDIKRPSSAASGDIRADNISAVKSKFNSLGRESKSVPRTALSSASKNTALGRYEDRIRSKSEGPALSSARSMPKDLDKTSESDFRLKQYKSVPDLDQTRNTTDRRSYRSFTDREEPRGGAVSNNGSFGKGGYTMKYDPNTGDVRPMKYDPNTGDVKPMKAESLGRPSTIASSKAEIRQISPSPSRDQKLDEQKNGTSNIPKGPSYGMDKYPLLNQIAAEMGLHEKALNDQLRMNRRSNVDNTRTTSGIDNNLGRASSTDTLIIRSDSEYSPIQTSVTVQQIRSEFEKKNEGDYAALAKSKSEPNIADSVRKSDTKDTTVFSKLKSRYESAPNLDRNNGKIDDDGAGYGMRRTVSGDLLDIGDRFNEMVTKNNLSRKNETGAEPRKLTEAALKAQDNLDSVVLPEIPRLTRRDSGNSLASTVREEYLRKFQRHYDVVRPPSPPSAEMASRMFAMNIDTIDREWQQEKRKRTYLKERVIKPDGAEDQPNNTKPVANPSNRPSSTYATSSQTEDIYGSVRRKSNDLRADDVYGSIARRSNESRPVAKDMQHNSQGQQSNLNNQRDKQSGWYPALHELSSTDAKHFDAYYGIGQHHYPPRHAQPHQTDRRSSEYYPEPSYPAPQLTKHDQPHSHPPEPQHHYHHGYRDEWHDNRVPSHHYGYQHSTAQELGDVPSTPRHVSAMELRSPSSETMDRKTRDEEAARRREQMEKIYAEERRRKMEQEKIANEARRHHDIYTPMQKSPIPSASERFEDALMEHERATNLKRPNSAKPTHHMRGKAKALYSFTAQNPKELSFKKGSVIYLLREIDNNWYEGEFRGQIGIFPKNYVEVMTSLETARQSAITREGHARARYNFTAATSVELPLKKGEIVQLIRRVDENWYEGRVGHRQGIIPVSYVEVIQEPDTPLMTPMSSLPNTPHTGSPSQLSPVSSVGHAPTIPEAPLSPWGVDDLDLMASYDQFFRPPSQQQQHRSPSSYSHHVANTSSSPAARHIYNQAYEIAQSGGAGDYGRRSNQPGPSGSLLNGGLLMPQIHHPNNRSSTYDNFDRALRQQQQQHIEPKYPRFRARFRYMPQNDDELELQENDIVQVMEKCDDGWYVGTSLRTNEFGTFPGNYVEPV